MVDNQNYTSYLPNLQTKTQSKGMGMMIGSGGAYRSEIEFEGGA